MISINHSIQQSVREQGLQAPSMCVMLVPVSRLHDDRDGRQRRNCGGLISSSSSRNPVHHPRHVIDHRLHHFRSPSPNLRPLLTCHGQSISRSTLHSRDRYWKPPTVDDASSMKTAINPIAPNAYCSHSVGLQTAEQVSISIDSPLASDLHSHTQRQTSTPSVQRTQTTLNK